jgi:hypothetical protein
LQKKNSMNFQTKEHFMSQDLVGLESWRDNFHPQH